ncbi:MAG: hypothetical protein RSB23_04420 [Alistipes sp.]
MNYFVSIGCCACLTATCFCALAQQAVGIAYYDVDRLYDTIPALFYNDERFTPEGALAWNTERYLRKICHTAAVIDSLRMPLVALYGVENEAVVRDLTAACGEDYCYIHRTGNAFDGLDFALLYYGEVFFPKYTESGRDYLYVEGTLQQRTIGLLMSSNTKYADRLVRDLREERAGAALILLGRLSSVDCRRWGVRKVLAHAERVGYGNARYGQGWGLRDTALADTTLAVSGGAVYARRYLIDPQHHYPLPTYEKERYVGGYARSLPIFFYLR